MNSYLLLKSFFAGSAIFAAVGAFPYPVFIAMLVWLAASRIMGKNTRKGLYLTLGIGCAMLLFAMFVPMKHEWLQHMLSL